MIDMLINVYLPHFFDWLIETSLMASILVGFILCIKILFRNKLTPRWQYMLWIVLMIRLLYHGHQIVLIAFIHYFPIVLAYRKLFLKICRLRRV